MAVEVKVLSTGCFWEENQIEKGSRESVHLLSQASLGIFGAHSFFAMDSEPGFWICIPLIPRFRRQTMTQNFSMFGYATPMEPLLTI